jgi:hypothetical protein
MEGQENHTDDEQKVNERARHPVRDKSNHPKDNQNPREIKQHGVRSLSGESLDATVVGKARVLNRAKQSSTGNY